MRCCCTKTEDGREGGCAHDENVREESGVSVRFIVVDVDLEELRETARAQGVQVAPRPRGVQVGLPLRGVQVGLCLLEVVVLGAFAAVVPIIFAGAAPTFVVAIEFGDCTLVARRG